MFWSGNQVFWSLMQWFVEYHPRSGHALPHDLKADYDTQSGCGSPGSAFSKLDKQDGDGIFCARASMRPLGRAPAVI